MRRWKLQVAWTEAAMHRVHKRDAPSHRPAGVGQGFLPGWVRRSNEANFNPGALLSVELPPVTTKYNLLTDCDPFSTVGGWPDETDTAFREPVKVRTGRTRGVLRSVALRSEDTTSV